MSGGTLASEALPATRAAARPRSGVVVSPSFDLAFFILPPLGTAAVLAGQALLPSFAFALAALVWVGLAQSHFGATLFFYLDPVSRRHFLARPLVYFAVPAALIVGFALAGLTPAAGVVLLAVPLFSFWHGNRQSIGIAGLYRGLSQSFDPRTRWLESSAIFAGSACFTAVGLFRLDMLAPLGVRMPESSAGLLSLWLLGFALALGLLLAALARAHAQSRASGVSPWFRLSILTSSWAMYLPYLLAGDLLSAYLAALVPHYLQYHGLIWLINRNKAQAGVLVPGSLATALVRSPQRYGGATIAFGLALGAILLGASAAGRSEAGLALVAGINVAHFWLDGFFWRFRDPVARKCTLAFIRRP